MIIVWESDDIRIWYDKGGWYILYKHLRQTDDFFDGDIENVRDSIRFEVNAYG